MPVLLWSVFGWRTVNLDVLGRWAGLIGLSLLAINILLSARLYAFDKLFGGLDRMYRVHHTIGCLTVIALLLHADLLILSYARFSLDAGYTFITSMSPAIIAGRLGLIIMVSALILVLYFKLSYKRFILAQRVMGAVIFLGGYHALFAPGSDVRRITPLFVYMTVLGGTAAAVYMYRSIFHKPLNDTFSYNVTRVTVNGLVTTVRLKPVKKSISYYAGQFAFVSFKSKDVSSEVHPFSISSGSDSEELEFNIKNVGDYTATLPKLRVGDTAEVEAPYGQFSSTKIGGQSQTWIAGGIGITPFLSMARSLANNTPITLFYSVVKPEEAIFLNELKEIAKKHNHFRVIPFYTDTSGLLTASFITKHSDLGENILLCGPPPMMKALEAQFTEQGVKKNRIHYEEFKLS